MTDMDALEREVRKIAAKKNGDPKTIDDLWALIMAVDSDGNTRHDETFDKLATLSDCVMAHHVWADTELKPELKRQAKELAVLKHDVEDLACIRGEHAEFHQKHIEADHSDAPTSREFDPDGSDFTDRRMDRGKRYTKEQIVTAVILLGSTVALNAGLTYFIVHALEKAFH